MKFSLSLISTLALSAACIGTSVYADTVQTTNRAFLVKYPGGEAERYVVIYNGDVSPNRWEEGSPSTVDHPIDTRRCHWIISSAVRRDVCLASRSGQQFCQGNLSTIYNITTGGRGSPFVLTQLHPENCGDALGRYQSDVANAVQTMAQAFPGIVENDKEVIKEQLKTTLQASSVEEQ